MSEVPYDYPFDPAEENSTAAAVYQLAAAGGHRILDLGSGPAVVSSYLASVDGRDVTCVDHDADSLEVAKERGVSRVIQADLDDNGWVESLSGEVFDVIILADVLEHLRKPEDVLRSIKQTGLLSPNGFMVVSIPNVGHEAVIAELITGNFDYRPTGLLDSTHIRFFTRSSFEALCEAHGWRIITTRRTTRSTEQTDQKPRVVDIPLELRQEIRRLNAEATAYQYVMRLVSTEVDDTYQRLRGRIEELEVELIDQRAGVKETEALAGQAEAMRARLEKQVEEMRVQLERAETEREQARDARKQAAARVVEMEAVAKQHEARNDALARRVSELQELVNGQRKALSDQRSSQLERLAEGDRRLHGMRKKLEEAKAEARSSRDAARTAQRRLDQVYASFTWKAGRTVKVALEPLLKVARLSRGEGSEVKQVAAPDKAKSPPVTEQDSRPVAQRARLVIEEDQVIRAEYERAVAKRRFDNDGRVRVAMAVFTLDFGQGRGDVFVAVGLGRYLERIGYEVVYLPRDEWYDPPPETEIYIALLSSIDASRLPDGLLKVAWVRNETENWADNGSINWFDLLLGSSRRSIDRLAAVYSGPTALLPIGVDLELFHHSVQEDERGVIVSTVNQWGRERDVYAALRSQPLELPLAIFGQSRGLAAELEDLSYGPVSFFSLPGIYRQARLVLDDFNHTTVSFGNVNSRVFEALAAGALPITNATLGLKELGLQELPSYTTPRQFHSIVRNLFDREEERETLVARLSNVVRKEHTFERRAAQLHGILQSHRLQPPEVSKALVAFFPDYRITNPYQTMLYGVQRSHVAVPVRDILDLKELELGRSRDLMLHIHWTAPILGPAASSSEALRRLDRFIGQLDEARESGAKILWTVHNVMPHETPFPDLEMTLRQELADRSDVIHVMCERTQAEIGDRYKLPETKIRLIPHGSFVGVYPDMVSPELARYRLGLGEDETVLLFLGGVRPYRGLDILLDAFDRAVRRDSNLKLLVAGRPGKFAGVDELVRRVNSHPGIVANLNHVANEDLQHFFKACDVVVLPYRNILNSGSVQLAFTFGRPVIAPRVGCLPDVQRDGLGLSYSDPKSADQLAECLVEAPRLRNDGIRRAARERAEKYTASDMAHDFADLISELRG